MPGPIKKLLSLNSVPSFIRDISFSSKAARLWPIDSQSLSKWHVLKLNESCISFSLIEKSLLVIVIEPLIFGPATDITKLSTSSPSVRFFKISLNPLIQESLILFVLLKDDKSPSEYA